MRTVLLGIIAAMAIVVIVLGAAVVRLENYRYADSIGSCDEYFSRNDPFKRTQRTKCLEAAIHALTGSGILSMEQGFFSPQAA